MPERAGEGLLRHVLSRGPVQATDLERPHKTRIVHLVDGDEVLGYLAAAVVFDDDSLSHQDSSRPPEALATVGIGGPERAGLEPAELDAFEPGAL